MYGPFHVTFLSSHAITFTIALNPGKELLREAQQVSGDNVEVATILNLGAGKRGCLEHIRNEQLGYEGDTKADRHPLPASARGVESTAPADDIFSPKHRERIGTAIEIGKRIDLSRGRPNRRQT
jgi:hypothetical protein